MGAIAILLCTLFGTTTAQADSDFQRLHNHVRSVISSGEAVPVASLPATQRLNLAIMLPLRHQSELTTLLGELNDANSPNYRQFLSVAQFTEQFAPTLSDYQAVVDFARANGFTITNTPANRLIVDINGSVEQIEKAFHVSMKVYVDLHPSSNSNSAENRIFYSPDREPSLELSVPVNHIAGLNNFSIPHQNLKRSSAEQTIHGDSGSGPGGDYLAGDMRAAYYGGTALTGSGQAVGLVEFDGYSMTDVTKAFDGVSYSVPINNVLLDGGSASSDGDDTEQVVDIVQAIGMAPGMSQVRVYIAPITTDIGVGDTDIFNQMATDNIAKQLSCSWGWAPDDPSSDDPIFEEFAAQGQNLFVASGDAGAYTGNNINDESYPAEDVYVTAVGATDLTTSGPGGTWIAESAWADSSGGPADNGFKIPTWQDGISNPLNDASSTIRDIPDVAAEGNFDNYTCYNGGCAGGWGGTSFAAPRWAAFLALVNQQAVSIGYKNIGFINPTIYTIGKGANYDKDFHDITSGDNNNGDGKSYNAVVGYDMVTGWGSPNGQDLINALAAPFTIAGSSGYIHVMQGSEASQMLTLQSNGNFDSATTLSIAGLPSGVSATFSTNPITPTAGESATSTLTLKAGAASVGTTTVTVTATSGSATQNVTFQLTVARGIHIQKTP
jgi:subtilase family serine protease